MITLFSYVKGCCKLEGCNLFSMPVVVQIRHSGFKLCQQRFRLGIREEVQKIQVEQYWNMWSLGLWSIQLYQSLKSGWANSCQRWQQVILPWDRLMDYIFSPGPPNLFFMIIDTIHEKREIKWLKLKDDALTKHHNISKTTFYQWDSLPVCSTSKIDPFG